MNDLYMAREGVQYGPFGQDKVRELIAQQKLVSTDLVWHAGMPSWQLAGDVLAELLPKSAPTPPAIAAAPPPAAQGSQSATEREQPAEAGLQPATVAATETPVYQLPSRENVVAGSVAPGQGDSAKHEIAAASTLPTGKPLGRAWTRRFEKIEQIVGPNGSKYASLGFWEKAALYVGTYRGENSRGALNLNILAALFGPIYYLVKGMWRQAISLLLIFIAVSIFAQMQAVGVVWLLGIDLHDSTWNYLLRSIDTSSYIFVFGGPANFYYYRKIKNGATSWL